MAKKKIEYVCSSCGYTSSAYYGKCPNCGEWNTLEERAEIKIANTSERVKSKKKGKILKEISSEGSSRLLTGISEFDRVMGGGIVRDSLSILTAKPGAGKSTLLLEICEALGEKGFKVLYASGEESESQIKRRADRILENISENIHVISTRSLDEVLEEDRRLNPKFIVLDSIQTFSLDEFLPQRAGNPTQTMACTEALSNSCKNSENPKAVMLVGQMTKDDTMAGVRALEHMVDTVLLIEGESGEELRLLSSTKNRYGSTGEMGFFAMGEKGMLSIDNPSSYFLTERDENERVEGSTLTVVREGTRPVIIEIESLVSKSFTPYPTRVSDCMRKDMLGTLISIIEERAGVSFYDKNAVVKTTGGMKLKETSANLAVIISLLSSLKKIPVDSKTAFIADVGLTGELQKVPSLESRIRELDRMGYERVIVARGQGKLIKTKYLKVMEFRLLNEVIREIFN